MGELVFDDILGIVPDRPGAAPAVPGRADAAGAGANERKKRAAAFGRGATILTGGRGLTDPAPIGTATLLGR